MKARNEQRRAARVSSQEWSIRIFAFERGTPLLIRTYSGSLTQENGKLPPDHSAQSENS
jgi:hypothetical protein